ncbi:MAG: SapC family protein [Methylacidiphilales bacterium]|nr:SapC family protein [Candidatus Methylacidiphilales bacterium]
MLSENPIPLEGEMLSRRIYAPQAYRLVREIQIVPIVHTEALKLSTWFPIAWRLVEDGPELVVLRALLADQRAIPPPARGLFPLLLAAYPFVFDPYSPLGPNGRRMIDNVFADEPTDIGAPIMAPERKPTLATKLRLDALEMFAVQYPGTRDIGWALADADLLEPWSLSFDIEDRRIEVPGLYIAHQGAFETGRYSPILASQGLAAAQLLGLHRISLFRAGLLLTMAKAVLAADRGPRQIPQERAG